VGFYECRVEIGHDLYVLLVHSAHPHHPPCGAVTDLIFPQAVWEVMSHSRESWETGLVGSYPNFSFPCVSAAWFPENINRALRSPAVSRFAPQMCGNCYQASTSSPIDT